MSRPRSLFLYSPVGHAHLAASRAVATAFGDTWQRDELDYLAFMPAWERTMWTGLYHRCLQHVPSLWRTWRTITDRPGEPRFLRERVSDASGRGFARVLRAIQPRVVVSTIAGAASLAGAARARIGIPFVNALVVTHFRAHRHWARPEADLVFVPTTEARDDLVRHGIEATRIAVVGTPVRDGLRPIDHATRRALRNRLGLGDDPVLVVSSGGTGVYRAHERLLALLEELDRPLDVLTFKGAAANVETRGRIRVHRLGFRRDFCDWLSASDACVGKIGSSTAAEACAVGVPIVVWEPIPGPEEGNAENYLVQARAAALWPRTPAELRRAIVRVLDHDGDQLARAAARLGRPDAAARIADILAKAA